ncbi:MAG TPA: glycerophosphodiester phosphodiesterase family protein [Pseudogracilibacillus sp.]|nr:glycerophosphodiester phosphodiesterase family protein [Pseudogracilibacillus sp.]
MKRFTIIILLSFILIILYTLSFSSDKVMIHNQTELDLLDEDRFIKIGHRGASKQAPEHTMVAYEKAIEYGSDYLEIDLQMTKDGTLIAMHDETVDRTTNGSGYVADLTFDSIKELDAGTWFNEKNPNEAKQSYIGLEVVSLEEIFDHFGLEQHYYIETKKDAETFDMEDELLRLIDEYSFSENDFQLGQLVIQSFSEKSLRYIHEQNESIPLIQLHSKDQIKGLTDSSFEDISEYAVGVGPNYQEIDEVYVKRARQANLLIHPYTIDDAKKANQLIDWGITGMFTNDLTIFQEE